MTKQQFLQEKSALLTVLLTQLSDAEGTLDRIEALEVAHSATPDHDCLAVGDLVADAYEAAEVLRDAVDQRLNVP